MQTKAERSDRDDESAQANRSSIQDRHAGSAAIDDVRPVAVAQRRQSDAVNAGSRMDRHRVAAEAIQLKAEEQAPANHTGLPDRLKVGIEALSGLSMDGVKVHYNSSQPAQLNARAYAQGTDIHVAPGQERHLPHEAWHVVQQAQGRVKPTMQMKTDVPVNDDQGLEREADEMGARAAAAEVVQAKPHVLETRALADARGAAVQMVDDMTHLAPLDLSACTLPSSGRSGNVVLLDSAFVYKVFKSEKEYEREVTESIALASAGGINVLFYKELDKRKVVLPGNTQVIAYVMMMYRAAGKTHMLAKAGGIATFKNIVDSFSTNRTQLTNLYKSFKAASDAGVKDAQFIYDADTNTPHFIDVHLGGVAGGGDCGEIADYIHEKLAALG